MLIAANKFAILSLFLLAITACQKAPDTPIQVDAETKFGAFNVARLQVVGPKGEAVAGAKVMVGNASSGRQIATTDDKGYFTAPEDWKDAETVSILADGYVRTSYFNQIPNGQVYNLHLMDKTATLEVKGVANGFAPYMKEKDGNVDFALVLPMLKREELYFFNANQVLSTENDYIEVFGQKIAVPSNISIPKQKEKYSFVTFTVEKPIYRSQMAYPGDYQMMAIRVRTTVGALKDRLPPMKLLNELEINGGSERTVKVTDKGAALDFSVGELNFTAKMKVTAPSDIPKDMVMLSVPLVQSSDYLYPSDVKSMNSNETRQVSVPATGANNLLNVVMATDRNKNLAASANLIDVKDTSKSIQFLGLLNKPNGNMEKIYVARPTTPSGVEPAGMFVTLSKVESRKINDEIVETTTHLWELFLDDWNETILLPDLPTSMKLEKPKNIKYRWEVSFMAADKVKMADGSRQVLKNLVKEIGYVTRNATDF